MGRVLAARTRRPTWDFVLRSAAPTPDMRVLACDAPPLLSRPPPARPAARLGYAFVTCRAGKQKSGPPPWPTGAASRPSRRRVRPRARAPACPPPASRVRPPARPVPGAHLGLDWHRGGVRAHTHPRCTPDVHLNVEAMDGSSVFQKDLQKLYFVYVSSKPEDWKFILEVPPTPRSAPPAPPCALRFVRPRSVSTACAHMSFCSADARAGQARRGFRSLGASPRAAFRAAQSPRDRR